MRIDMEAFARYMLDRNSVYAETTEEFDFAVDLCRSCGFPIGFDPGNYHDTRYYSTLCFGIHKTGEIHCGSRDWGHPGKSKLSIKELEFAFPLEDEDEIDCAALPDVSLLWEGFLDA